MAAVARHVLSLEGEGVERRRLKVTPAYSVSSRGGKGRPSLEALSVSF